MGVFDNYIEKNGQIVDNGWIKWFHAGIADEPETLRLCMRIFALIFGHCLNCTALSGCYFVKSQMPKNTVENNLGLLHESCHCQAISISKPIFDVSTYCSIEKFTGYIFAEKGLKNGKAALFKLLGFDIDDSYLLKLEFEKQAKTKYLEGEYTLGKLDRFGQNINITVKMSSEIKQNISFVSGWKVHPLGYITCNTPLGG